MTTKKTGRNKLPELRKKAEALLSSGTKPPEISRPDFKFLSHELQVHQIELEVQNEELRQSHSALERSNRRFSDLYDFAPVGYVSMDRTSRIIEANLTVSLLLGIERSELIGKPFNVFVKSDDKDLFHQHRQALTPGLSQTCEIWLKKRNDEFFFVEIASILLPEAGEASAEILTAVFDITLRKKSEEILQRTERLDSLGVLAGGLAHDFNNLLSGIIGYVDLAQSYAEDGGAHQAFQTLAKTRRIFDRAKYLTQRLLTFSKGGDPVLKKQSMEELVRDCADFALSGSAITVQFSIEENLLPCFMDENQMSQVIHNIVLNARQAMPGSGSIEIIIINVPPNQIPSSLPPAQKFLKISIRDHGAGIHSQDMQRIFDPFFTTKAAGSGLGLAISDSIVKKHHGLIDVESMVSEGTTFHIYLPASQDTAAAPPEKNGAFYQEEYRGDGKILIMDDEESIRDVASAVLSKIGYCIVEARNGDEAIDCIKTALHSGTPIIGAFLDLSIPGGRGGADTIQELRLIDPDLVVIASSGYSDHPIMANPGEYGFNSSLPKPYHAGELIDKVKKNIKARKINPS
jgi:PAS domain S-box-containing protein